MSTATLAPAKRWSQFSLRTILLLMFLAAALFAWYANGMARYRAIVAATTQLQSRRAMVEWHLQSWPRFDEVTRISMRRTSPDTQDLATLGMLTDLAWLSLAETPITDDDLGHLAALVNLGELDLSDTRVSDAGLPKLAALPSLAVLKLGGTSVTNAGVASLKQQRPELQIVLEPTPPALRD